MTTLAPSCGEPAHGRQADAGAPAGDDGDLALEPACHVFVLSGSVELLWEMKTFLTSVNASSASGPSSRPMPTA